MGPEPGVGVRSEEDLKYTLIPLTLLTVLNPPSLKDCSWVSNNAPPFVVTGTFFSYIHWWKKNTGKTRHFKAFISAVFMDFR